MIRMAAGEEVKGPSNLPLNFCLLLQQPKRQQGRLQIQSMARLGAAGNRQHYVTAHFRREAISLLRLFRLSLSTLIISLHILYCTLYF
jgi:hypothetical protein